MSEEIRIDFGGLKRVHASIETARSALTELSLTLPEGETRSEALSEFRSRVEDLRNIVVKYENLLWKDSVNLLEAGQSLVEEDSAMARMYSEELSKSLYGHK